MDILEKIYNLPQDVQDFFMSNENRLSMERICFLYEIQENDMSIMADIVRDIFIKDLPLKELPMKIMQKFAVSAGVAYGISYELCERIFSKFPMYFESVPTLMINWKNSRALPLLTEEKAWRRVLDIEPWIMEEEKEKREAEKQEQTKYEQLSLNAALAKYPNMENQAVTTGEMTLKSTGEIVRPSIKNWITDFHDALGANKHTPIERGQYLFQSENAKKLSALDRQRLGMILKSLDDESLLKIDLENERIVFENDFQQTPASLQTENVKPMVSNSPRPNMHQAPSSEAVDIFDRYRNQPTSRLIPKPLSSKESHVVERKPQIAQNVLPEIISQKLNSESFHDQEQTMATAETTARPITAQSVHEFAEVDYSRLQKFAPKQQYVSQDEVHASETPATLRGATNFASFKNIQKNVQTNESQKGTLVFSSPQKMTAEQKDFPVLMQSKKPEISIPTPQMNSQVPQATAQAKIQNNSPVTSPQQVSAAANAASAPVPRKSPMQNPYRIIPRSMRNDGGFGQQNSNSQNIIDFKF